MNLCWLCLSVMRRDVWMAPGRFALIPILRRAVEAKDPKAWESWCATSDLLVWSRRSDSEAYMWSWVKNKQSPGWNIWLFCFLFFRQHRARLMLLFLRAEQMCLWWPFDRNSQKSTAMCVKYSARPFRTHPRKTTATLQQNRVFGLP